MPPCEDVEGAVSEVLKGFDERTPEGEEENAHPFWDSYVIGGRWAGEKLIASLDKTKIEEFCQWMKDEKVTVSSVLCGKQELAPKNQIPKIDQKWNELFPHESGFLPCPMFEHSSDRYGKDGPFVDDICRFEDVPEALTCHRFILASPSWSKVGGWDGPIHPAYMIEKKIWNGVIHVPSNWDGMFFSATKMAEDYFGDRPEEFLESVTPKPDWPVVTVDYHS